MHLLFQYGQQSALHARTEFSHERKDTAHPGQVTSVTSSLSIQVTYSGNNARLQNFLLYSPLVAPIHPAQQF